MKGFAILLLLLVVLVVGIFIGGSLGVLGKPNDVFLQTDYTYGVLPYFHQGDRIHFFDPNQPLVSGQFAPVQDITIPAQHTPCKSLDANGICIIDVPSGIFKYRCHFCGDPTIPIGTNGPTNGTWGGGGQPAQGGQGANRSPAAIPGASEAAFVTLPVRQPAHTGAQPAAALASYSYDSFYARLARAFVAAFFTPKITPGRTITPDRPMLPAINSSTVQAYIDCGADHTISVETPDLWEPDTSFPLALGTRITWAGQTGFSSTAPHPFTVQSLPGSTDFTSACGAPLQANGTGATLACTLSTAYPGQTIRYTIVDSSPNPTCTAPNGGFTLPVTPAAAPPAPAAGLPAPR